MNLRLFSVSMTLGSTVTTRPSNSWAFSARAVARQCTPDLANAQANISGCGSLQTAAAPVKLTSPPLARYLVARWAARRDGQRLTSFICLTLSKQSSSLMLPPVQPPAVTRMALKLSPRDLTESMTSLLLSWVVCCCRTMLCLASAWAEKSTLTRLWPLKTETTLLPSCPDPPMHRMFFITLITMLQNQFITPQELAVLHLQGLMEPHSRHQPHASHASELTIARVLAQLNEGEACIYECSADSAALMDPLPRSNSQQRLQISKQKLSDREMLNQLLYSHNKNKPDPKDLTLSRRLLSNAEHSQFVKDMCRDNRKLKQHREQREKGQLSRMAALEQAEKQSGEARQVQEIERKKEAIRDNLRKMRENHDQMLATEHESRTIFNSIRKKKRLYQAMQQVQDQQSAEISREVQKRLLERREDNRLDHQQLENHAKDYLVWKVEQTLEKSRAKLQSSQNSPPRYHPPAPSKKQREFMAAELQSRNKLALSRKKMEDRCQKIAQYQSVLKDRFKSKSPPANRTVATDRDQSGLSDPLDPVNRTQLGNQYLKQAKLKAKKRSKTEERYFNPEERHLNPEERHSKKARVSTLSHIPEHKRDAYIERKKRQELEGILSGDNLDQAEKLRLLKVADERVGREVKRREEEQRTRYSTEGSEETLNLLLGSIRAKIGLLNAFKGQK